MSGSTIISPNTIDTTLAQDGQAAGSFTLADLRQVIDSLSGLRTFTVGTSYTLQLTDRGTQVESTSASAVTFTVPPNSAAAFQVDTVIGWRQYGNGQITFAGGAGVTLRTSASLTSRALYSSGSIQKRATDEWVISGDLT